MTPSAVPNRAGVSGQSQAGDGDEGRSAGDGRRLLIRQAEERELRLEVGVRFDATGAEFSVGQVGGSGGEDVIGQDATVGVGGRAAAVIVEDVGEQG